MRQFLLGFGMVTLMAGCGDPLRDVTRLSDVAVTDTSAAVAQTPAETRNTGGGLFSRLLNRTPDDPTNAAVAAALSDVGVTQNSDENVMVASATTQVAAQPERRGLGALFRRNPDNSTAGLRTGPDTQNVAPGTVMPFGQIARVCNVRGSALGTQIESDAGFRIYDTIPNTTALRPFYITGFDDKCARTFTGAVVVTGDVQTHEFVRYRPSNEGIAYTSTDNAYEALKTRVCRVGRGEPCGANTPTMNRDTQFITVYNFFGGTFSAVPTQWAQILIHNGDVLAMSIKDGDQ